MRKHLFLTLFMVVSMMASAQFVGSTGSTNKSKSNVNTDNWYSFRLSYNPMTLDAGGNLEDYFFDDDYDDLTKFKGFSGEFKAAFNVVQGIPLFLEAGLGFLYSSSKYEDSGTEEWYDEYYGYVEYDWEENIGIKFMSLYVPLNIGYKLSLNESISVMPYLGLKARYNLNAKFLEEYTDNDETEDYETDLFDTKEMKDNWGEDPFKAKRFQLGWQIGADVEISNFILGVSYGSDLGEIMKDCKFKTTQLSLGLKF